jgi:lipoprotein-releasing system permease protein
MFFEFFLGLRYLKAKRKQAFISVITLISILGVMVGVMALVIVLSVMNGFRADLMSKILGVNSDLLVLNYEGAFKEYTAIREDVIQIDGVVAAAPFIYSQVILNRAGNVSGAVLRGLDPQSGGSVTNIADMIRLGSLDALATAHDGLPAIIIGSQLSKQIGAYPGDSLTVISPEGKLTPVGRAPNNQRFMVVAIFDSGMYEYDASMAYVSLDAARQLLGIGDRVSGLEVKVQDVYKADQVGKRVQEKLGYPFWSRDWKMMNRSLFSALKLEKIVMFIILTMIVMVGALNIISTLVMVVMEKGREVAILRAMGASARSIMSVFMIQGLLVSFVGTLAGIASGLGLCHLLARYKFINLPADVYYISTLPVRVELWDVLVVAFAAVLISFLATLYPSWHASRMNPLEALRYE